MSRTVRNWCDICRDLQPDISCSTDGCGKKFHEDCLRNAGYWRSTEDSRDNYICEDCRESTTNDKFCYICKKELHLAKKRRKRDADETADDETDRLKKSDLSASDDFVLCDGCANSAHISCLGVRDEDDFWFCTECDPNSAAAALMAKAEAEKRAAALQTSNANAGRNKLGGNVDICYVCQKGGKLLGCDFCEQAYHPRCIDADFLEFEATIEADKDKPEADKWRCPICKGEDPLKNMAHKRLSRTAMMRLAREWQECIRVAHRQCMKNRDKFLWSCRDALLPFATQRTLNRLKKQFAPNSQWPQKPLRKKDELPTITRQEEELEAVKAFRVAERKAKKTEDGLVSKGVMLKSYQIIGVGWLLNAFHQKAGAILADEMGLGKTIQCLTFLSALKASQITGPHLIVVPLSTVGNWAREIRKFVPHLKFVKICGSRFEREHTMSDPTAQQGLYDLYITTYETVVTEESFFCDNFSWQCVILDEAHRIKNEAGRIRHSLDRVAANMRVLLTGTPLQNNVRELFTLLNFLFPDVLRDSDAFQRVKPGDVEEEELDDSTLAAVTQLLGKMMLRRTKDLVVRLPRKFEHDIWLPLSPVGAEWYRKLLDVSETAVQQQSVKKLLGTVVKMRICCCHPRGLVTRDAQLKRFKEVFAAVESEDEIEAQATKLIELEGEAHIRASSKLMVLDKLLTQFHVQNLQVSETYTRDFIQNVKDLYVQAHPPAPPTKVVKAESPEPPKPDAKQLTTRQLAERARRERAAQAAQQQAELEAELEKIGAAAVRAFKATAADPDLFADAMVPAVIPDMPLPELPEAELVFSDSEPEEPSAEMGDSSAVIEDRRSDGEESERRKAAPRIPHKVLVFTQFQLVLDELERYCQYRGFKYLRLDGGTNKMIRELDIREFNSPQSTHLIYLICTRAGGVGINLVTANHVVLFDEDWNPFIDLQAIDRAHRIGQKRDVHVWKLITEWTVEERMAFRRMQKLKLDKLLIQAHAETTDEALMDEDKAAEEKFSVEEIRRLIRHGRTAIMRVAGLSDEGLAAQPLEACIARERQVLPVIEEPEEADDEAHLSEEERRVSLIEALEPEDREICLPPPAPVSTDETADETLGERRRLRRRQPLVFVSAPVDPVKPKVERKIIHEKRCFRCGSGVNPADESADPLVSCHRCPKVYHRQGCLGFDEFPKKTWTCPWHECCLCFRKGSQAGGLLIHCAECPTTFCFDCFPPEYRRFTPPATYYSDLTKRGYPMTPDKLVLFLCSRCKALKEQARRRLLSKQQLELEAKLRKEANLKARADAQRAKQAGEAQREADKKSLDARREFQGRKRQIDDDDKFVVKEIRAAYERLFPAEYLQQMIQKRETQSQTTEDPKPPAVKTPGELLKLCENCHLPCHEAAACPFPPETEKRNLAAEPTEEERMRGAICKRQIRSFCAKCGVSSRNHSRKHCDQLSVDEMEEYEMRKGQTKQFVEALKAAEPVPSPPGGPGPGPDAMRRLFTRQVDEIVARCLTNAGLGSCAARREPKRRRRQEDSAAESDDPSYSPRKKSRLVDEPASEDDRPRRRPRRESEIAPQSAPLLQRDSRLPPSRWHPGPRVFPQWFVAPRPIFPWPVFAPPPEWRPPPPFFQRPLIQRPPQQ